MAQGTSPLPPGTLSMRWMEAGHNAVADKGPWLAKMAAIGYLAGLVIIVATGWHDPGATPGGLMASLPTWHMAFLMATGTGVALLTLARDEPAAEAATADTADGIATCSMRDLMDQLSHELRTPLNAVIGFSEVMASELHGPLGNARYQEYAQHISDSGGQLLKSSMEALAVTEAMTALMTDRSGARRERMIAATLVREAWRAAAPGGEAARLVLTTCTACDITGERRPTVQALQHLLREALEHAPAGSTITARGRRQGGRRSLEVGVAAAAGSEERSFAEGHTGTQHGKGETCDPRASLRVILARLLLEMQGARVAVTSDARDGWRAVVEFPAQG
jgi:two-component system cell cycle sensor histidine kinase PleC